MTRPGEIWVALDNERVGEVTVERLSLTHHPNERSTERVPTWVTSATSGVGKVGRKPSNSFYGPPTGHQLSKRRCATNPTSATPILNETGELLPKEDLEPTPDWPQ